ncbi:hypothetical protein ECP030230813_4950 [Escherichia coli P0302308.13]|nr:hypothetical protein ECP030230813_4950 [Escherichia coli P0302308.13]
MVQQQYCQCLEPLSQFGSNRGSSDSVTVVLTDDEARTP